MRHPRVLGLAGIAALAVAAVAFAQTTPPEAPAAAGPATPPAGGQPDGSTATVTPLDAPAAVQASAIEDTVLADLADTQPGDAEAGAAKAAVCAACHGVDGNPSDPQYPRIAGQNERYIARQLALFKAGQRTTPMAAIMQPYAMPLSAQDMRDIGAYFADQSPGAGIADDSVVTVGKYAGLKFFEVGQQLYRAGDFEREIPACMACHGPAGRGNPGPPYPAVAGQFADYTARQLELFREGMVMGSGDHANTVMAGVAAELTDQEIQALASYIEGLHPRASFAE
ncbi:MAG TPA: c-type cytochrome [Xanthomonadaceae bacterium]|nr:c-type cytochrome [Xanthomonadaceae bacterium]